MTEESDRQIKETTPTALASPDDISPHPRGTQESSARIPSKAVVSHALLQPLRKCSSRFLLQQLLHATRWVIYLSLLSGGVQLSSEVCLVEGSDSEVLQHANWSLLCQLLSVTCLYGEDLWKDSVFVITFKMTSFRYASTCHYKTVPCL